MKGTGFLSRVGTYTEVPHFITDRVSFTGTNEQLISLSVHLLLGKVGGNDQRRERGLGVYERNTSSDGKLEKGGRKSVRVTQ